VLRKPDHPDAESGQTGGGTGLTDFYVAAPACSPSRAAVMTGNMHRVLDPSRGLTVGIAALLITGAVTVVKVLKSAGYLFGAYRKAALGRTISSPSAVVSAWTELNLGAGPKAHERRP